MKKWTLEKFDDFKKLKSKVEHLERESIAMTEQTAILRNNLKCAEKLIAQHEKEICKEIDKCMQNYNDEVKAMKMYSKDIRRILGCKQ